MAIRAGPSQKGYNRHFVPALGGRGAGDSIPRISQAGIDARVLAFSALLVLLTSLLFSMAPAIQVARANLAGTLKEGAANIARGHNRFRSALAIGQMALRVSAAGGRGTADRQLFASGAPATPGSGPITC